MKVIIIEDETLSEEHLSKLLVTLDETIEIVGRYESVKASVNALKKEPECDILFVDIHLADGLSFEIFAQVKTAIPIIFTTAYEEYAIQAFKLNSVDYLLKPIASSDLKTALLKYNNTRKPRNSQQAIIDAIQSIKVPYKDRFMVKTGKTIVSVKVEDIDCIVSEDRLVFIFVKGTRYIVDYTLDRLEKIINPNVFFRINRKAIVNINSIEQVNPYSNNRLKIEMKGLVEDHNTISRERVQNFKRWLDN